jgi:DNA ligase-1
VSFLRLEFRNGGLHLPQLALWMDPNEPQLGPEKVFVSHAHSDHIAEHREVILSAATARLMKDRLSGERTENVLDFGERRSFTGGKERFDLTLLPAGHIFGSAMALVEAEGQTLLYTGDFKLRLGLSAELCAPRPADILVMETTYGRPQYVFPPTAEVLKGIMRFCREALDNDEVPVLFGYSLGKSQELLCGLSDAGLPMMLHGAIYKLTKIYQQFGQCFPRYEHYEAGQAQGKVLLCPPNAIGSALVRNLGKTRKAILTGWAVDPNCRYRYQCDAAFPLSDHADFPDLIEMVKRVAPKKVYTLHGFAADFAQTLRGLGYDAQALSENEQLALALVHDPSPGAQGPRSRVAFASAHEHAGETRSLPGAGFQAFASTCRRIGGDSRKLEKIRLLAEYLRELKGTALEWASTWFTGRPFAASQNKVLQVGWAALRDAVCSAAGVEQTTVHQVYLKHSDLGETVEEILQHYPVEASLSLEEVGEVFQQLHSARGPLAKTPILTRTLAKCTPLEAKYLVKIITGDLRIGLKEGLVEEAIAAAFARPAEEVRRANLLLGDVGKTAVLAAENRLGATELVPFRPVKFMLASPEETAAGVFERVQESARTQLPIPENKSSDEPQMPPNSDATEASEPHAAWVEDKYDGIRCQFHKVDRRVALYSRDLKEITPTFLELADSAREMSQDFILDGEIVAMRGEEVLPFAELQKRLGRRAGDLFMREEVPISLMAFDCLWLDGASLLDKPLRERRAALEALGPLPDCLRLARVTKVRSAVDIEQAFTGARARGNEGLMIKDPESPYTPGRRGLAWLKLKKALATLDCVVIGAEYGHGKRNKVLSDYTFAVRDERSGELKTIGKAYTGLTDAEIGTLTEHFLKTAIRRHGRYFEVPPDIVLEIAFDRLQLSDRHSSGMAMRFPRIVRIRSDKSVAEIDTVESAIKLLPRKMTEF